MPARNPKSILVKFFSRSQNPQKGECARTRWNSKSRVWECLQGAKTCCYENLHRSISSLGPLGKSTFQAISALPTSGGLAHQSAYFFQPDCRPQHQRPSCVVNRNPNPPSETLPLNTLPVDIKQAHVGREKKAKKHKKIIIKRTQHGDKGQKRRRYKNQSSTEVSNKKYKERARARVRGWHLGIS